MKKILFLLTFAVLLCFTVFGASAYENEEFYKGSEGTTINVFNWGEYISDTYEASSSRASQCFTDAR